MKVETFEQNEVINGQPESESDPAAIALIESLNLKGQRDLTAKTCENVTTRCPYRVMTKKENRVYSTLYPAKVKIEDYREGMIPLRVLQIAAHAKGLSIYENIEIWCETGKPVDPILVGQLRTSSYEHDQHILARWGETLEPFDALYEKAKKVLMENYRVQMEEVKRKAETILTSLEYSAIEHLKGEWIHLPS